jgi:hypothetical protein
MMTLLKTIIPAAGECFKFYQRGIIELKPMLMHLLMPSYWHYDRERTIYKIGVSLQVHDYTPH